MAALNNIVITATHYTTSGQHGLTATLNNIVLTATHYTTSGQHRSTAALNNIVLTATHYTTSGQHGSTAALNNIVLTATHYTASGQHGSTAALNNIELTAKPYTTSGQHGSMAALNNSELTATHYTTSGQHRSMAALNNIVLTATHYTTSGQHRSMAALNNIVLTATHYTTSGQHGSTATLNNIVLTATHYTTSGQHRSTAALNNIVLTATHYTTSGHYHVCFVRHLRANYDRKHGHTTIKYRSYKNFGEKSFLADLAVVPWSVIEQFDDVDDALDTWEKLFMEGLNMHAPLPERRVKRPRQPGWLTEEITDVKDKRDSLKQSRDFPNYKLWRNKVVRMLKEAKADYYINLIEENRRDTRALWTLWTALREIFPGSTTTSVMSNTLKSGDFENIQSLQHCRCF